MLPPFIIDQIRRREEERREFERPRLELPIDDYRPREPNQEEPDPPDGVVILDLG